MTCPMDRFSKLDFPTTIGTAGPDSHPQAGPPIFSNVGPGILPPAAANSRSRNQISVESLEGSGPESICLPAV